LGDLDPRHGLLGAAVDEKGAQRGVPPAAAGVPAGGMAGYGYGSIPINTSYCILMFTRGTRF